SRRHLHAPRVRAPLDELAPCALGHRAHGVRGHLRLARPRSLGDRNRRAPLDFSGGRMRTFTLALVLLTHTACGARQKKVEAFLDKLPPPTLLPADALTLDVVLRQHVSARWATGETEFDAVVQKHEGTLKLVALSPTGQPGFVLTLGPDGEVRVENRTGQELPFRPERILADVQKVYYPWIEGAEDTGELRDGARRARVG